MHQQPPQAPLSPNKATKSFQFSLVNAEKVKFINLAYRHTMQSDPVSFRIYNHSHIPILRRDLRFWHHNFSTSFFDPIQDNLYVRVPVKVDQWTIRCRWLMKTTTVYNCAPDMIRRRVCYRKHAHLNIVKVQWIQFNSKDRFVKFGSTIKIRCRNFKPAYGILHKDFFLKYSICTFLFRKLLEHVQVFL